MVFTIRTNTQLFTTNDQPDGKLVGATSVKFEVGDYIAIKVPGFKTDFGENGNLSYIPAEYQVYKITKICKRAALIVSGYAELVIDFPVRGKSIHLNW